MPWGWALIQEPNRAIASYISINDAGFLREKRKMDESLWGIMTILGPVILLIVLVWLVMNRRSTGKTGRTEQATHDLYQEEEARRREGTDKAEE